MKKLLFLLVLTVLSFAARAQMVNVNNMLPCTISITFYMAGPNCQILAVSNPPTIVAPGGVVPVNLGNPALWGGVVPPPGAIFGAQVCVVCPGIPPVTQCVGKVGCLPCFAPTLGPVFQTCCAPTVVADWICTPPNMQLNVHL